MKRVKVKGHKRSRSKVRVKVTINGKEKAGGLTPTSSCFIKEMVLLFCVPLGLKFEQDRCSLFHCQDVSEGPVGSKQGANTKIEN